MIDARFSFALTLVALELLTFHERPTHVFVGAVSENFTYGTSTSPFSCGDDGEFWCGATSTTVQESGALSLMDLPAVATNASFWSAAIKSAPVQLFDTTNNQWNSFHTSFVFRMFTRNNKWQGDGMTFVMLSAPKYNETNGTGGYALGLPLPPKDDDMKINDEAGVVFCPRKTALRTLAVEFDIFQNPEVHDVDDNHVGVDVDTPVSRVWRSATDAGISLFGQKVHAWIDYDAPAEQLNVRICDSDLKPDRPFLSYNISFEKAFGNNKSVYVGFTAGNNQFSYGTYQITDWRFQHLPGSTLLQNLSSQSAPSSPTPYALAPHIRDLGNEISSIIVGGTAGSVFFFSMIGLLFLFVRQKGLHLRVSKLDSEDPMENIPDLDDLGSCVRYSYKELDMMIQEDSKLGQGGFGNVYQGVMPGTGQPVAIKRVSKDSRQGLKEFVAEVSIISELRHRNIVKLLGWGSGHGKLLLVYELMPNGSLDKALFDPPEGSALSWDLRRTIIVGAAEALQYLHEGWRVQIIHRDFKSSNILLDEKFNAMLGDFGLARKVDRHLKLPPTTVAGTYGYLAPEAVECGNFTPRTDVYAFGVVVLEVVTGQKALYHDAVTKEMETLASYVWKKMDEGNLLGCVDPRLENVYDSQEAEKLLLLGLLCSHRDPHVRPSTRQVLDILAGTVSVPPVSSPTPSFRKFT